MQIKYIFISQPMRGRTEEDLVAERLLISRYYESKSTEEVQYRILDSLFLDKTPEAKAEAQYNKKANEGVLYLGESLKVMAMADIVVFLTGWHNARGCKIEFDTCKEYGIPIKYWDACQVVAYYGGPESFDS